MPRFHPVKDKMVMDKSLARDKSLRRPTQRDPPATRAPPMPRDYNYAKESRDPSMRDPSRRRDAGQAPPATHGVHTDYRERERDREEFDSRASRHVQQERDRTDSRTRKSVDLRAEVRIEHDKDEELLERPGDRPRHRTYSRSGTSHALAKDSEDESPLERPGPIVRNGVRVDGKAKGRSNDKMDSKYAAVTDDNMMALRDRQVWIGELTVDHDSNYLGKSEF